MTLLKWLATVALVAACAVPGYAQTDQGKLTGSVRDSSGAFVSGATVTAKNERTGEERSTVSYDQGFFLLALLMPLVYTVPTEKSGFGAIEYTGMTLAVGQELALD